MEYSLNNIIYFAAMGLSRQGLESGQIPRIELGEDEETEEITVEMNPKSAVAQIYAEARQRATPKISPEQQGRAEESAREQAQALALEPEGINPEDLEEIPDGGMSGETRLSSLRPEPERKKEAIQQETRSALRGFFDDVRDRVRGWFAPKKEKIYPLTDYDINKEERQAAAEARRRETNQEQKRRAEVARQVEQRLAQDSRAQHIQRTLDQHPDMLPGNRARYQRELDTIKERLREDLEQQKQDQAA